MSTLADLATALVVSKLGDADLLTQLRSLVRLENQLEAEILPHLGEVEHRRLYLNAACSSMFGYCTQRLGMSEQAAYQRTQAARGARRYPVILELVGEGDLHLAGVCSLNPYLTNENYEELLFASVRKGRKDIEQMLAGRFPRQDVPDRIRKVPQRAPPPPAANGAGEDAANSSRPTHAAVAATASSGSTQAHMSGTVPERRASAPPVTGAPRAAEQVVQPLSEARFRVQFTADLGLRGKIQRARELLSHAIPDGDLARVFERGLDLLIQQQEKRRLGIGVRPRGGSSAEPPNRPAASSKSARPSDLHSRHIPAAVRRQVWERDGGQCTYVDSDGHRCAERSFLEFEHRVPFGKGGASSVDNVRLLCRAHNRRQAERAYGHDHVARSIAQSRARRGVE